MTILATLALRNMKLYFRDRAAVFFSLLSVLVILAIYALFLGQTNAQTVENMVGTDMPGIRWLVDSWIMAGITIVISITVTLAAFAVMIEDEKQRILDGFLVTPILRSHLVLAYLAAAIVIGTSLSLLTLLLSQAYIVISGGQLLSAASMLQAIGLVFYSVITSACLLFFLITWVKTSGGFSTLSTIVGTLIGFFTGIYLPIGILPETLQSVMKWLPFTQTTSLMRQIMTRDALDLVFADAPSQAVQRYAEVYGIHLYHGGSRMTAPLMLFYVGACALAFLFLSFWRMRKHKKR